LLPRSAQNARKHAQAARKIIEYKFSESHIFGLLSGMSSWQGKRCLASHVWRSPGSAAEQGRPGGTAAALQLPDGRNRCAGGHCGGHQASMASSGRRGRRGRRSGREQRSLSLRVPFSLSLPLQPRSFPLLGGAGGADDKGCSLLSLLLSLTISPSLALSLFSPAPSLSQAAQVARSDDTDPMIRDSVHCWPLSCALAPAALPQG
jgi:hypothetical protein